MIPPYLANGTADTDGYAVSALTDRTRSHALRKRDHSALVGRTPQSPRASGLTTNPGATGASIPASLVMCPAAVFELLEYPLADPRLGAVDARDNVQFGNAESAVTPFDVLLEAVVPDFGLPPGPQLG